MTSATCSRSRASSCSRPSPTTGRPMRSPTARSRSPPRTGPATRPGSPVSARPSVTRSLELARTGHLAFYDRLVAEVPPSLVELLRIPGVGPRTVRILNEELGIETLEDLRQAAEAGRLRRSRGCPRRPSSPFLEGIAALEARDTRMLLGTAEELVETLIGELGDTPGLVSINSAGSFRRRRETIGDLDLLAETSDPAALVAQFTGLASVDKVLGSGSHKAAVRLLRGPQVDLMIMPPGAAGTYLIHFTGSKDHNVKLRGRARDRGWSLSEHGFLRIGEDGEPLTGAAVELRTFPTETEAYRFLDLDFHRARAARGPWRGRGRRDRDTPAAGEPGRPAGRSPLALGLVRRGPHDRADGRRGAGPRPRLPGPHRPQPVAGDRPWADPGSGRAPAGDHRPAQRRVCLRGGGRHRPARHAEGGLPPAPRLRARDPGRRPARLRGRPPGQLRPRRCVTPRGAAPARAASSPIGSSPRSAALTSTSSPTRPGG